MRNRWSTDCSRKASRFWCSRISRTTRRRRSGSTRSTRGRTSGATRRRQLPEHGLFLERSQRARVRGPNLGRQTGALRALRAVKPIQAGSPRPLGATWTPRGVNFALFSSHATRVELCIFDAASGAESARYDLPGRTRRCLARPACPRAARAPARATRSGCMGRTIRATAIASIPTCLADRSVSRALYRPRSRCGRSVIDRAFDWEGDRPPATPWRDTVIYELHVKGYHPPASRCRELARQVSRSDGRARDRAPEVARRDRGRAAAVPSVHERTVPARARPVELLGLQPGGLVRAGERVRRAGCGASNSRPW